MEEEAVRYLFESDPEATHCARAIGATLGLRGKQAKALPGILRRMVREGELIEKRRGYYRLAHGSGTMEGKIRITRSGAGIVTDSETGNVVFVESRDVGHALPGDQVKVRFRPGRRSDPVGVITGVTQAATRDVVGTLLISGSRAFVSPLNPVYKSDFQIADPGKAQAGDRVVVRVARDEKTPGKLSGEIIEIIGPADKPSLDTLAVMKQYDLPEAFPPAVLNEAETVAALIDKPGERREDLRDRFIITIDPATARDFDDAVSLRLNPDGSRELGVHIADVSHYVLPGSALDREARERGTSVYLVDRVIPMLPEQLSNGVCSLQPGVDRLAFSAFLTYDEKGRIISRRFARTRIRSRQRLTYEQALAILEKRALPADQPVDLLPETTPTLLALHTLTEQLRAHRKAKAALELASQEVDIALDKNGRMTGIHPVPNDISHQLIEACMVAANEAVATELTTKGIAIIARLHEAPDEEKIAHLVNDLKDLGFRPRNLNEPKELARFLEETADHPLRYHAHTLVLRAMKRALYSAEAHGHFGLALEYYSHFTSPIRRYPDLTLHRQLADYLTPGGHGGRLPEKYLIQTAALATEREIIADDASRTLDEIKKYRFLQQQLDDKKPEPYPAVIVKVMPFGFFVDVLELQISGMVHISAISRAYVRHDPGNETLNAQGVTYKTGMEIKVLVTRVDFTQRRIDFALIPGTARDRWPAQPPAPPRERPPRPNRSAKPRTERKPKPPAAPKRRKK